MAKREKAADLDPDLVAACEKLKLDPASLLASKIYDDRVVVIDSEGRKLSVER